MKLLSLQLGRPHESVSHLKDGNDAKWVSSIWREAVTGRVHLGRTDLDGNAQADLKNHGGPDKAVCCYSAEHYPDWRSLLGLSEEEFGCGAFGENFTVSEMTEDAVCLGDIYTIGTATVQVSQPRMPCWKVGRRWERPDLPGEMTADWPHRLLPARVGRRRSQGRGHAGITRPPAAAMDCRPPQRRPVRPQERPYSG